MFLVLKYFCSTFCESMTFYVSNPQILKSMHPKFIEHRRGQLQLELESLQGREMQLVAVKEGLEEELKCSKSELEACREQLEASQVELSKNKVHAHTLDKRNKVYCTRMGVRYKLQW